MINNELVENIPLDKEGCLQIIHQSEELGYGWCVALDDTKDVYMTDDKFLRQVGKRKEPTRYIIDNNCFLLFHFHLFSNIFVTVLFVQDFSCFVNRVICSTYFIFVIFLTVLFSTLCSDFKSVILTVV